MNGTAGLDLSLRARFGGRTGLAVVNWRGNADLDGPGPGDAPPSPSGGHLRSAALTIGIARGLRACPKTAGAFRSTRGARLLHLPRNTSIASNVEFRGKRAFRPARTTRNAGVWRVCGYLTQSAAGTALAPSLVRSATYRLPRPTAKLNRRLVLDTLLASRRVPTSTKADIRRAQAREPGYGAEFRWARLTSDRYRDAVVAIAAGGAGRRHDYYIVTAHGKRPRVAFANRRAFNVSFRVRGRTLIERIPVYAPSDALCCASRLSVREIKWKGGRFKVTRRLTRRT